MAFFKKIIRLKFNSDKYKLSETNQDIKRVKRLKVNIRRAMFWLLCRDQAEY